MITSRPCPICAANSAELLFEQRFEQLSGARLLDGYSIVLCDCCGAAFADGIPTQDVFDEYYRELSKYEGGYDCETEPPLERRFQDASELLSRHIPAPDARVLEIGCGYGQLLWVLRQRGFCNLLGADPSPGCARAAKQFYGVEVITSTIYSAPPGPHDFLILTGVMEHIRDLDRAVACFRGLLAPGGRIFLEVPDASRLEPAMDAPFQEFSVEHINYFSPTSLNNLMTERGFRTVESGRAVRPLHEVACRTAYGVYELSDDAPGLVRDVETGPGLRAYIEGCRAQDAEIRAQIRSAIPPGGRILVWGVGAHTLRLLATGGLEIEWVEAFIDSNSKYQSRDLRGRPVIPPAAVVGRGEPILISSRGFQNEIHRQIRKSLGAENTVILLYPAESPDAAAYNAVKANVDKFSRPL